MTRPIRYTENNSSRDWIDEFCATKSVDEVRGAFLFNMGKYQRRYGKKDDHLQEALKIQDYASRLVEYERSLAKPIIHELYSEEDLAAWDEGEKRMEQIGPNGNDGAHYWQINRGVTPALPSGTRVKVEYRNGDRDTDEVHECDWSLEDSGYDIIRWRLA